MTTQESLQKIMQTYHFEQPVPPHIRAVLLKKKRDTLIAIFRKHGQYSFYVMMILSLYFWLKKAGIGITIAKASIIVGAATTVVAGGITAGAAYGVKKKIIDPYLQQEKRIERKIEEKQVLQKGKGQVKKKQKKTVPRISYRALMKPLVFDKSAGSAGRKINAQLQFEIERLAGRNVLSTVTRQKTPRIISGSIVKLGTIYRISVKVIDRKSSRIVLFTSETAKSTEDISRACRTLARKISASI